MIKSVSEMHDEGTWVDASLVGSSFVVEFNQKTGQSRYRPRDMNHKPFDRDSAEVVHEWRHGNPPKSK